MNKIISVSLWGDNPRYGHGAIENAKIAQNLFPGWRYRVYLGSSVPSFYKEELQKMENVDIIYVDETTWGYGMFWRFNAMFESDDNIFICRDSDTRLLEREKRCIDEWIESDKKFSIIRDHPRHFDFPIIGTLWGMKGKFPEGHLKSMREYEKTFQYVVDQIWLANVVWPIAKDDCIIHELGKKGNWFSESRQPNNPVFVGQGYDEKNNPIYPSWA
jgi:hypothetical protein